MLSLWPVNILSFVVRGERAGWGGGEETADREHKQATFLSTRTAAGSKLCRYR